MAPDLAGPSTGAPRQPDSRFIANGRMVHETEFSKAGACKQCLRAEKLRNPLESLSRARIEFPQETE
jgi:hypothetical protein